MPDGIASEVAAPTMFLDGAIFPDVAPRSEKTGTFTPLELATKTSTLVLDLFTAIWAGALSVVLAPEMTMAGAAFPLVAPAFTYTVMLFPPALATTNLPTASTPTPEG